LELQQFNLLGTDDLKAPLQEPPKATESENPKHNCNELFFLAAAAVTAALWSLKERDGSAEIVKEDEQEQEEQEEMEDDAKLLFVDDDIAIDAAEFAEAMVLITAAISKASKASKRICNNQEICDKTGEVQKLWRATELQPRQTATTQRATNETKDFPAAFPKLAILFLNFFNSKFYFISIFRFSLAANFKTENANRK
jgi:hypothetical protein